MHLSSQYAQLPEWTVLAGVIALFRLQACAVFVGLLLSMLFCVHWS